MDLEVELLILRAEDEFLLATSDLKLLIDKKAKETMGIQENKTFFHSVISHSYYSIFYSAKAYLLNKGIKTETPSEHLKTYQELKKLAKEGVLSKELLNIYKDEIEKANFLLKIFKEEKTKRGSFIYNVKSEANKPYAQESIDHAKTFISAIKSILEL